MTKSKLLENLNKEQVEAVTHKNGPLLIIAGAGTGKTTVITHRIAWLIEQKMARPEEILALTFTEKAAAEMEERVDVLVPYGYIDTWISTFHAFGDRILRENFLELGISGTYEVMTKTDQMIWLKDHLFEFPIDYFRPLSNPTKHIDTLINFISRCKDENISPQDYEKYAVNIKKKAKSQEEKTEAEKQFELSQFYKYYQNLLISDGKFDFGDLIIKTIELFKTRPDIIQQYQKKFKYILVDEFQDTNYAQNMLVKILASSQENITVVGDDDQSIYKFRGAAISNILDFKKTFSRAKTIVLCKNYRSTKEILDCAYKLIQNNNPERLEIKNQISKRLISNTHGRLPQIIYTDSSFYEVREVIESIKNIHKKEKTPYSEIAILARANNHLELFIQELAKEKIPYIFSGDKGLFEMPEIRVITAFIKVLVNPFDNLSHYILLGSEFYNMDSWQIAKVFSYAKHNNMKMTDIFEQIIVKKSNLSMEKKDTEIISNYVTDLKYYLELAKARTAGQLIYQFLTDKKYLNYLLKNSSIQNEIKIKNISLFFQGIARNEKYSQDKSIYSLAENISNLENYSETNDSGFENNIDAVNVLTVHSAKGLEFDTVYMVNLVQDRFPSRTQKEPIEIPEQLIKERLPINNFHIQEERRLFYVGMTRAKKNLYFCFSNNYGGVRKKKTSIFVAEALETPRLELTNKHDYYKEIQSFQLPFEDKNTKIKVSGMICEGKFVINPHQIDDYLTCPLKFKYIHILEIPVIKYHYVVYGNAIHQALQFYFEAKLQGKIISLKDLLKRYEYVWNSEGFINREHEEKRFKHGINSLTNFYNINKKQKDFPFAVEKSFKVNLKDNIVIKGRFDTIYERCDNSVEILDYKTSEIDSQEKADKRAKDSNQLAIYAMAWKIIEGELPKFVSLNFIDSSVIGKYKVEKKRVEKIKNDIALIKKAILDTNFSAKPSYNNCHYCAYKSICSEKYKDA